MVFFLIACTKVDFGSSDYYTDDPFGDYELPKPINNNTLKDVSGWEIDTLAEGLVHYNYSNFFQAQNANQIVNVVELDLNNPEYQLEIKYVSSLDSLSNVASMYDAVVGINGTYEIDASFIKSQGVVHSSVTLPEDHLRYWKHEGAMMFDVHSNLTIDYGTNESYLSSPMGNILSGSPILFKDREQVGKAFVGDNYDVDLNTLDGEDYRKHQGIRHPRTAVAVNENGKLLLITVDGRRSEAAGMNAKEMTEFLEHYFEPKDALNIDGGGSSTMYIKDKGDPVNNIVNFPTDNGKYDHYGQRRVRSFLLIRKLSSEGTFAGGDGTKESPYLLATARHMQNMHTLDWGKLKEQTVYFELTSDINMTGVNWSPLNNVDPYERNIHFDGKGHIIKNLSSKGHSYASLFGVLIGKCINLGLENAAIESTNGGGIIAGYVGLKGPNKPTGIVENCFTDGTVSGRDAVGGIAGNIGKPNGDDYSAVINSYSTADVTATNETGSSRAGGIAGIVWEKGILKNCYASGKVTSKNTGAGGVIGWTDSSVEGLVSFNSEVINEKSGNIGRIAANMASAGGQIAQGVNCWASSTVKLNNGGTVVLEKDMTIGAITVANSPYDGETKQSSFLGEVNNYQQVLGWEMGEGKPWSSTLVNGMPQLSWENK